MSRPTDWAPRTPSTLPASDGRRPRGDNGTTERPPEWDRIEREWWERWEAGPGKALGKRPSKVGKRAREKWEQEMWTKWRAHQDEKRRHPGRFRLAGAGRKPVDDDAEDHDERWAELFEPEIEDPESDLDETPGLGDALTNPAFVLDPKLQHDFELTEYSMREFDGAEEDLVTPRRYTSGKLLGRKRRGDTVRGRLSEQELPEIGLSLGKRLAEERRLRRAHGVGWNRWTIRAGGVDRVRPIFAYSRYQGSVRFSHWWRRWFSIFQPPKEKRTSRGKVVFPRTKGQSRERVDAAAERRKEGLARGREKSIKRAEAKATELAAEVQAMRSARVPYRAIASEFSRRGIPTARGGKWTAATVRRLETRAAALDPQGSAILARS
jgi:hypothetical protein